MQRTDHLSMCSFDQDRSQALAQLLSAIKKGDYPAFTQLHRIAAPRLRRYARRLEGNADSADEILQESLLAIWSNARLYDPAKAAPMTWLRTIVRNQAFDLHRRQTARLPGSQNDWDPSLMVSDAPDPSSCLEQVQANVTLSSWLKELEAEPRLAIELTWLGELSHRDAAEVMNKPLGSLKTLVRRALIQLRQSAASSIEYCSM